MSEADQLEQEVIAALGHAIRSRRLELSRSQELFAEQAGLHRTYVGSVERGERNVSLRNLLRIAHALEIRLSDLIASAEAISLPGNRNEEDR